MTVSVLEVKARNIKGLKFVRLVPKKTATLVGGKNGAGKTSLLDSIAWALGGAKLVQKRPLRDGQDSGEVRVTLSADPTKNLSEITVVRTFNRGVDGNVTSDIKIISAEGFRAPRPQEILDDLIGRIGFDPLAFLRLDRDKQAKLLMDMLGLDLSTFKKRHDELYEKRRQVGVMGKEARATLNNLPEAPGDTPDVEFDLSAEEADVARARQERERLTGRKSTLEANVANKTVHLARVRERIAALEAELSRAKLDVEATERLIASDKTELEGIVVPSIDDKVSSLETKRRVNLNVAAKARRSKQDARVTELLNQYSDLSDKIDKVLAERAKAITDAKWPLEGLGYDEELGITFKGRPIDQASTAEQTRLSIAIGAASAKDLKAMFIREGSLLDDTQLETIVAEAAALGAQLFIERVGEGAENDIIIRDGEAVEEVDHFNEEVAQ